MKKFKFSINKIIFYSTLAVFFGTIVMFGLFAYRDYLGSASNARNIFKYLEKKPIKRIEIDKAQQIIKNFNKIDDIDFNNIANPFKKPAIAPTSSATSSLE
jgi:hypothetical protein